MQIHAASLLAIEVDTEKEKRYLQDFAAALRLDHTAVGHLHSALGRLDCRLRKDYSRTGVELLRLCA